MSSNSQLVRLETVLRFSNGKISPSRDESGAISVYGSNGLIGFAAETNSPENTIVIGRVGSYCGSVHFSKTTCWVTDNAIKAIAKNDNDPYFLYYVLKYLNLNSWRSGSGQPLINQTTLNAIEALIPSPALQKSISSLLGVIDDHIALLRENNATLEAIAQALFKSWFLDFDPVCVKQKGKKPEGMDEATAALFPNSFENSALGEIPKGWEIKNLGQVAYNVKSRIKNAEDWKNLDLLDLSRMPRKILFPFEYGKGKELSTSVFEFKKDDCLFGAVRPYFHKVCHATRNGVTNSSVLVIRSLVPENQFFVNLVASSKECVTHATSYSQGTKMPTINWENLSRFSIVCPPDYLQSIFCEYVSLFFKKALNNSLIINLLTELRDVLLPRLVTGQLKLPNLREINNKTMENH